MAYILPLVSDKAACPKNIPLVVSARNAWQRLLTILWVGLTLIKSPSAVIFYVIKWELNCLIQVSRTEHQSPWVQWELIARVDSKPLSLICPRCTEQFFTLHTKFSSVAPSTYIQGYWISGCPSNSSWIVLSVGWRLLN